MPGEGANGRAIRDSPDPEGLVVASAGQRLAGRREGDREHVVQVPREGADKRTIPDQPEPDGAIPAAGGQSLPVRRECDRRHCVRMPAESPDKRPFRNTPHIDGPIPVSAGQNLAVWGEGDGKDRMRGPGERTDQQPVRDPPDLDGPVPASAGECLAVRRVGHAGDSISMPAGHPLDVRSGCRYGCYRQECKSQRKRDAETGCPAPPLNCPSSVRSESLQSLSQTSRCRNKPFQVLDLTLSRRAPYVHDQTIVTPQSLRGQAFPHKFAGWGRNGQKVPEEDRRRLRLTGTLRRRYIVKGNSGLF